MATTADSVPSGSAGSANQLLACISISVLVDVQLYLDHQGLSQDMRGSKHPAGRSDMATCADQQGLARDLLRSRPKVSTSAVFIRRRHKAVFLVLTGS